MALVCSFGLLPGYVALGDTVAFLGRSLTREGTRCHWGSLLGLLGGELSAALTN